MDTFDTKRYHSPQTEMLPAGGNTPILASNNMKNNTIDDVMEHESFEF